MIYTTKKILTCAQCGKDFQVKSNQNPLTCSNSCRQKKYRDGLQDVNNLHGKPKARKVATPFDSFVKIDLPIHAQTAKKVLIALSVPLNVEDEINAELGVISIETLYTLQDVFKKSKSSKIN